MTAPPVVLEARRRMTPAEADDLVGATVPEPTDLIEEPGPFLLRDADTGAAVALVDRTPGDRAALRRAVMGIAWHETVRGSTGLRNRSRVFGYAPRKPVLRRESCRVAHLAVSEPVPHAIVSALSGPLAARLSEVLPEEARDLASTPVDDDWRLSPGGWTSGVINRTSALPFHRDGSNFDAWSAMPVVRRGTAGGHLSLPEYGVTLPARDGFALYFNGHRLVHGVTPIRLRQADGYRITVVFYCLRGMKDCATFAEETALARRRRTERERSIAATILAGADPEWVRAAVARGKRG